MPSGDVLQVSSFLIGLAASFYIQTLRPEIWRVRVTMWIAAAILLLIGLAWPFLIALSPPFAASNFVVSMTSLASNAWAWFILLMVGMISISLLPAMRLWWENRFPAPTVAEKSHLPVVSSISSKDDADRREIFEIFHNHGGIASNKMLKFAEELYEQLQRSENEEKKIIARLAKNLLFNRCSFAQNTLIQALGRMTTSSLVLQEYLGDFFLSYFALVYWIPEIDKLLIPEIDKLLERGVLTGEEYILWQEYHRLFLDDIRRLHGEGDFPALEKRIVEGQRGTTE